MLDSPKYDPHSPKTIDDIVGNTDIIKETARLIQTNTASHLILVGPTGCGKSLFLRLALVGFLTLSIDCTANAGLRDVRDNIRIFARGSRTNDGKLRWIIFEHAEALTSDTQAFLRRMLETTSNTTRIVFECKDAGAISEPILSRSKIVSFVIPETTEIIYELMRRTDFEIPRNRIESIVRYSFGNIRSAMLNTLATRHIPSERLGPNISDIETKLSTRPGTNNSADWIAWAIDTEIFARRNCIDLRDVLRIGWSDNAVVANTCSQWSRLGGTSPRTLFFDCVASLVGAV
jgi:replication-associated recombination protein RarA